MAKLYEDGFTLVNEALGQVEKELEYVQFIKDNVRFVTAFILSVY